MSGKRSSAGENATAFCTVEFVFLDRDGVINRKPPNEQYVSSWKDIEILPGAERAIALLNQASRTVIVVTNQRGIALHRLSESDLLRLHENLQSHLDSFRAHLDAIYYCPHDYDQCDCRKPATGMFEQAFRDFSGASPKNSVMIGDSDSDIVAGNTLGMKTILITNKPNSENTSLVHPNACGRSLLDVVETYLT